MEEEKPPNIKFVGRGRKAPTAIHGVTTFLDLPDPETQAKGFYYERANELIRTFPRDYKRPISKGE